MGLKEGLSKIRPLVRMPEREGISPPPMPCWPGSDVEGMEEEAAEGMAEEAAEG